MRIDLFMVFLLLIGASCHRSTENDKQRTAKTSVYDEFIYRDSFLIAGLTRTIAYCKESSLIDTSKDIPESLIKTWLTPFSVEGAIKNKMLSYQFNGGDYHSLLLLVVGDKYADSLSYACYDTRQYFITTDSKGRFIDGINVYKHEPGLDSVINNKPVVMIISRRSTFYRDTVKVFTQTNYLQQSENGDKISQEEFEVIDEETYVTKANGFIKKIDKKKGEVKKL
jgi:hypothetical protein